MKQSQALAAEDPVALGKLAMSGDVVVTEEN